MGRGPTRPGSGVLQFQDPCALAGASLSAPPTRPWPPGGSGPYKQLALRMTQRGLEPAAGKRGAGGENSSLAAVSFM